MQRASIFFLRAVVVVGIATIAALLVIDVSGRRNDDQSADALGGDRNGLHPGLLSENTADLFDQSELRTYAFTVEPDDLAQIDADPTAEQYVPATLRVDGLAVGDVGLRYKGSIGSFVGCTESPIVLEPGGAKTCTKLSMKAKINWDGNDREFYGVRRLQFHSQNLDQSHLRERLGYWLFAEMGVVAPRSVHAKVVVNDEFVGLFALTENVDGRFVRDRFDDGSGNLYKSNWPLTSSGRVRDAGDLLTSLRTNENDDDIDVSMIQSFAEDIIADPATAPAAIERWTDIDRYLAYYAVDRAIRHDDGPLHWYCSADGGCGNSNFYWYEEPDADRLHLIPWDLDGAFENLGDQPNEVTWVADDFGVTRNDCKPFLAFPEALLQRSAACDPLLAATASFETELAQLDAQLRSGPFARIDERIDDWTAQIEPAVIQAANAHDDAVSVDAWRDAIEQLRDDLGLTGQES
ncbi:MAG: CotH kinase family protein [Actinomycetota bacterium]